VSVSRGFARSSSAKSRMRVRIGRNALIATGGTNCRTALFQDMPSQDSRVSGNFQLSRSRGRCWPARSDLGEWWPSGLVATAEEDRLSFRRNPHTSFAAVSDCRTIAIYEYTRPLALWMCFTLGPISQLRELPRARKACQRCLAASFRSTS